jgi:hypothetical protein
VILHIRYTAREGGGLLRNASINHLRELINDAKAIGSIRLFSVRQEFSSDWNKFVSQQSNTDKQFELKLELKKEHYPYWSQDNLKKISHIEIVAQCSSNEDLDVRIKKENKPENIISCGKDQRFGNLYYVKLDDIPVIMKPTSQLSLYFSSNEIKDIWIAVNYG